MKILEAWDIAVRAYRTRGAIGRRATDLECRAFDILDREKMNYPVKEERNMPAKIKEES